MKILVVGGTGLIGGHAALYLQGKGHEVTLMARSAPTTPVLAALPFLQGNYAEDDCGDGRLQGFDGLVFCAGVDIRQMPRDGSVSEEEFYTRHNIEGIPRFFEAAKAAGIKRAVYIGSFYPQVVPDKVDSSIYVRSRKLADDAVCAMSGPEFNVCSLNAPFVLGQLEGLAVPYLNVLVQYAQGKLEGMPIVAPAGGTNHITVTSLSEAIAGALDRGESGRAYLVGDENLSWKQYFEMWFECVGNPTDLDVSSDEHPLLPDIILFAGRNATVSYEPEAVSELGYSRNQVKQTIAEIVAAQSS